MKLKFEIETSNELEIKLIYRIIKNGCLNADLVEEEYPKEIANSVGKLLTEGFKITYNEEEKQKENLK